MEYQTKQRKVLLDFFNEHLDQKLTAKMIFEKIQGPISLSAIYRNLAKLEQEGILKRFSGVGDQEIYYQYIKNENCQNVLHISCIKCKETFHLHEKEAKQIESILGNENFLLDKNKTVLYGVCDKCKQ